MSLFQSSAQEAPLSLALQGGGAHGAFTWGVLDELLAHGAHPVRAISGTSAGALNAAVLAHGWLDGGADGVRAVREQLVEHAPGEGAVRTAALQRETERGLLGR